jgi:hypothetical protein
MNGQAGRRRDRDAPGRLAAVEHLILLLVELGRWIDKQFQKRLRRAVPELDRLLEDPRGTLAAEPVVVGPHRKYGSGVLLGLVVTGVAWLVVFGGLALAAGPNLFPLNLQPRLLGFLAALLVLTLLGSTWLVLYALRGGQMALGPAGVELRYHRSVVHCPWALFNTAGHPFLPRPDVMLLPVAPRAVPFVEARVDGTLQATGDRVHSRQFRFRSATEARLRPLYEVNLPELGGLLLQLGRALGQTLPDVPAAALEYPALEKAAAAPPAAVGADGWLTVRLTRLACPPFCCDCGAPTDQLQGFSVLGGLMQQSEGGEHSRVRVPVCEACQAENRWAARRTTLKGLGVGLGIVLLAVLALWAATNNVAVLWTLIPLGLFGALAGLSIGQIVGQRSAAPVKLQRYSPTKGTIAIRFRWPEYGERVLAFMEIQEASAGPAWARVGSK